MDSSLMKSPEQSHLNEQQRVTMATDASFMKSPDSLNAAKKGKLQYLGESIAENGNRNSVAESDFFRSSQPMVEYRASLNNEVEFIDREEFKYQRKKDPMVQ